MKAIGYSGVVIVFSELPWCDDIAMVALDELWSTAEDDSVTTDHD